MGIILGRSEAGHPNDTFEAGGSRWWLQALDLAEAYDWVAAGTKATQWTGPNWDHSYETSDGQYVTPEDAVALAAALEAAAADPDLHELICDVARSKWKWVTPPAAFSPAEALKVVEWTDLEAYRTFLRKLASFCNRGGFWIA